MVSASNYYVGAAIANYTSSIVWSPLILSCTTALAIHMYLIILLLEAYTHPLAMFCIISPHLGCCRLHIYCYVSCCLLIMVSYLIMCCVELSGGMVAMDNMNDNKMLYISKHITWGYMKITNYVE